MEETQNEKEQALKSLYENINRIMQRTDRFNKLMLICFSISLALGITTLIGILMMLRMI